MVSRLKVLVEKIKICMHSSSLTTGEFDAITQ